MSISETRIVLGIFNSDTEPITIIKIEEITWQQVVGYLSNMSVLCLIIALSDCLLSCYSRG